MYTGSFSFFFSFFLHFLLNISHLTCIKALITHQMFGAKETIRARCSQEKEKKRKKKILDILTI